MILNRPFIRSMSLAGPSRAWAYHCGVCNMSQRKKNTRRYVLRCQGVTPDGRPAKFPMKAVIFTRSNPSGSVVVLYRPGCGSQIGAFSYDALVALEATAREARQALGELIQSVPKGHQRRSV